jgi:hypothetical protein
MTYAPTCSPSSALDIREDVPYTEEDYDFIAEITEDCTPINYKPLRSLIPLRLRMRRLELDTAEQLGHAYNFPWRSSLRNLDQSELATLLDEVVLQIEAGNDGYMRHRDTYCRLSLAMNELGLQAPAFRPQPTIPWETDLRTSEHMVVQRDRIAIDCHWLFCSESKVYATEGKWRGIVNPKLTLQTERIEKFAATKLRNDSRAEEILQLNTFQQVQMAAMRGAQVQKAFKSMGTVAIDASGVRVPSRFRQITRKLQNWANSQPRFAKLYPKYRAYAIALELLEEPSIKQVSQLAGLILGEPPLTESTATQTLRKLNDLISET